jgi:hypothetical protein
MKRALASAILLVAALAGTAFAADNYKLSVEAPKAAVSARSVAKIKVLPTSGFHINVDYPTKVTITPPDGVTLEKAKQTSKDAVKLDKSAAEFDVAFTSSAKGKKTFTGELKFAVCTENTCDPRVEKLSFEVDVR